MSRRREPRDDAPDPKRQEQQRFWNSPLGWAVTAVAMAAFVGLSLLSLFAALVVAALLVAVELADQVRRRAGPWLVEATPSGGPRPDTVWRVSSRRRSRQVVEEVERALERGQTNLDPPGAERVFGPK